MIACPYCMATHPENTLFCNICGSYLGEEDQGATGRLADEDAGEELEHGHTALVLETERGTRIQVRITKEVILGRLDVGRAVFPDVDLTNEQGAERGLSREHARISRHGSDLFVEDLGSTNGTLLNGDRLVAGQPYPVTNGDHLQLAKLALTIRVTPTA